MASHTMTRFPTGAGFIAFKKRSVKTTFFDASISNLSGLP